MTIIETHATYSIAIAAVRSMRAIGIIEQNECVDIIEDDHGYHIVIDGLWDGTSD